MDESSRSALDQFMSASWMQGGIDYSDTHFLALRMVCDAVTKHRLHRLPLDAAYISIGQLIKAPIEKFHFSFLLRDDEDHGKISEGEKKKKYWETFVKYKEEPTMDPAVIRANKEGPTKDDMLDRGISLLRSIFVFNGEEEQYFNRQRWSELLGAVLLNGQERSPFSPYTEFTEMVSRISPAASEELRAFHKRLRSMGIDHRKFSSGSRGQGIYAVGCLFNHSCLPNLQVLYSSENDETLTAVCLRDIAADEELCISYIQEDSPYRERQQQLFEHYLFTCRCTKCLQEADEDVEAEMPGTMGSELAPQPGETSEKHVDPTTEAN
jgi:hypothetical protein